MNLLESSRMEIDNIDREMALLFEKRMDMVRNIITYKKENNMPVFDQGREQIVIEKNKALLSNPEYTDYFVGFITSLMNESKRYQKSLVNHDVVGYQGTVGAFAHIALTHLFKENKARAFATWDEVFRAVEQGEIISGVLPFENSFTGEVGEVLDLLYKYDCHIIGIYDLKINQNLLGVRGAKLTDIKQVYSHHQALSQSKRFLDAYNLELIPYPNTATAAQYVSQQGDKTKAAVASSETAKLYNLDIIAEDINTSAENTTRFVIISKTKNLEGNRFNMMFTLDHNAGQLANVMQIISKYGFSMESIKSKPIHNLPWQYYFYVEIIGDINDDKAKSLLKELEETCKTLKVLGVYNK